MSDIYPIKLFTGVVVDSLLCRGLKSASAHPNVPVFTDQPLLLFALAYSQPMALLSIWGPQIRVIVGLPRTRDALNKSRV
jgi:hypothetical protein